MLNRIILHVGPPKTGTTTIQTALHAIGANLLRFGIYYPHTNPLKTEGHPELAWQILAELGKPVGYLSRVDLSWDRVLAEAADAKAHTLFISSEDFCLDEFDAVAFAYLRKLIGGVPVTVVFAIRDPVQTMLSAWRHSVKWGVGSGEELLDINQAVAHLARRAAIRVSPYIDELKSGLGEVTIRLFTVPNFEQSAAMLARFAEAAELPDPIHSQLCNAADFRLNPSLSYNELAILLQINRLEAELEPASHTFPSNCHPLRLAVRADIIEAVRHLRGSVGSDTEAVLPATIEIFNHLRTDLAEWICGQDIIGASPDPRPYAFGHAVTQPCLQSSGRHDKDAIAAALQSLGQKLHLSLMQLDGARDYLGKVSQARDWWHRQAELWEQKASGIAE